MSGPYQALVILHCLQNDGRARLETIAKDLASRDQDSVEYYIGRLKRYPREVLKAHGIASIANDEYFLDASWDRNATKSLIAICEQKLTEWAQKNPQSVEDRGNSGWGLLRFNLLRKFPKCLLCGAKPTPENDVELDIDHIRPSSKGGPDTEENLQVLCAACNRAKQNLSQDDFRPTQAARDECVFCSSGSERTTNLSKLFWVFLDKYPVTTLHTLIVPRSHLVSPTEMGPSQWAELGRLTGIVKQNIQLEDPSVTGFNLGFNDGLDSGQTVMHAHFHIIPRRSGDILDPRGGIRGVIPERQKY